MWRHIQRSTFEELLERDETISIHHKNDQSLAIELYKFLNGYSPEIINSLFHLKENNRKGLSDASVVSLTKNEYGSAVHFL